MKKNQNHFDEHSAFRNFIRNVIKVYIAYDQETGESILSFQKHAGKLNDEIKFCAKVWGNNVNLSEITILDMFLNSKYSN